MRIALIGEYSGLHNNLKAGLQQLGHEVVIFASGDGFKQFPYDRYMGVKEPGYFELLKFFAWTQPALLKEIVSTFDVIQLINPGALLAPNRGRGAYYRILATILKQGYGVKSLVVAGCDNFVERQVSAAYPQLCGGCLLDQGREICIYKSDAWHENSSIAASIADVIVPFSCPTYAQAYAHLGGKNTPPLMFPLETRNLPATENIVAGKIKLLHGIIRPGFKGSEAILNAMHRIQAKYPNRFEIIVPEKLPFAEYIAMLSKVNVVLDQSLADGFGMNALFSMALGRVVMTSYNENTVMGDLDYRSVPAINITGGEGVIFSELEKLLDWDSEKFRRQGMLSRQYVEEQCEPAKIAEKLVDRWNAVSKIA